MILSTLGFIYTPSFDQVLLIEKQRPVSHKGKLNGLGGKCEAGEDGVRCIVREVKEEAGIEVPPSLWVRMGHLTWEEWNVEIFAAVYPGTQKDIVSSLDGKVAWYPTPHLPSNVIENLHWLVPLGIDCLTNRVPPKVEVQYYTLL